MDIAKEDRTLDSCAHRGKVQPCRSRSRRKIGIDLETIWDDDVYPIGVAIVMVMMAVFLVSFAVTRRWKSWTRLRTAPPPRTALPPSPSPTLFSCTTFLGGVL